MSQLALAQNLRHLFTDDDGSLPDIFIEEISPQDFDNIISWIEGLISPSSFQVWSQGLSKELTLISPSEAAKLFSQGEIESFRFWADDISFDGQTIPTLGVGIYSTEQLEFDYRMGENWTDETIVSLLTFLSQILKIAPDAKIRRDGDMSYPKHEGAFKNALSNFQKV